VYLNYASADELRRLPGCGPKRADAILAMRQRMGKFQRVEDLLRIKGIGRAAVRKWRPLVRLDAPAPPPPASAGDAGPTSS
jgi:competence protein ComEA